jgi:hypothetical protein
MIVLFEFFIEFYNVVDPNIVGLLEVSLKRYVIEVGNKLCEGLPHISCADGDEQRVGILVQHRFFGVV